MENKGAKDRTILEWPGRWCRKWKKVSQAEVTTSEGGLFKDFQAMLHWFSRCKKRICCDIYRKVQGMTCRHVGPG